MSVCFAKLTVFNTHDNNQDRFQTFFYFQVYIFSLIIFVSTMFALLQFTWNTYIYIISERKQQQQLFTVLRVETAKTPISNEISGFEQHFNDFSIICVIFRAIFAFFFGFVLLLWERISYFVNFEMPKFITNKCKL